MLRYRIDCARCRDGHAAPHERIEGLGGSGPPGWYDSEETIIRNIERGVHTYYTTTIVKGCEADVVVSSCGTRRYLKTGPDGYEPTNLLRLPRC